MAEAKHAFVDDYPYLVYTNEDTLVYSNKADTSIDDIGGGGDSDLAIASVYIKNTSSYTAEFGCPIVEENDNLSTGFNVVENGGETTQFLILYKGKNDSVNVKINDDYDFSLVTFSTFEGVSWDSDSEVFEVTGNGAITIANKE